MYKWIQLNNRKVEKLNRKTPKKLWYRAKRNTAYKVQNCDHSDSFHIFGVFFNWLFSDIKRKHTFSPAGQPVCWTEWICLHWRDSIYLRHYPPIQKVLERIFTNKMSDHTVFFKGGFFSGVSLNWLPDEVLGGETLHVHHAYIQILPIGAHRCSTTAYYVLIWLD